MAAPPPLPIAVHGSVRVEIGSHGLTVNADGDRVAVEFADVGSLKALMSGPGDGSQLRVVAEWLQRCELEVVIQLKGETIATLGRDAEPGAFEKMFSLGAVDVKKRRLIKALFKRGD